MTRFVGLMALLALLVLPADLARAQDSGRRPARVDVITIKGTIDVPMSEYVERTLAQAVALGAEAYVIELDTPGGLLEPMQDIVKALLSSSVPTVVYVYPPGGNAFSAGALITMAAHFAVMHPDTTIGAAHPVALTPGAPPTQPSPPAEPGKPDAKPAPPAEDATINKVVRAMSKWARTIAEARGRNGDWAERAVTESAAATASEAVKLNAVDFTARDLRELLDALDGKQVTLEDGRKVALHTRGVQVNRLPPNVRESFLHVLTDPNILLILMVLGGLGIIFELQNPGAVLPGVVGGICMLLALYSLSVLPVNWTGVALILLALGMFVAEIKVVSHGVLTVGGLIAFVLGALMLVETPAAPALRVSWLAAIFLAAFVAGFVIFAMGAAWRAHKRKVVTGQQGILGARGRARTDIAPEGTVFVQGEYWRARAENGAIPSGEPIEVIGLDGFVLRVRGLKA